jgi:hypothetical protein
VWERTTEAASPFLMLLQRTELSNSLFQTYLPTISKEIAPTERAQYVKIPECVQHERSTASLFNEKPFDNFGVKSRRTQPAGAVPPLHYRNHGLHLRRRLRLFPPKPGTWPNGIDDIRVPNQFDPHFRRTCSIPRSSHVGRRAQEGKVGVKHAMAYCAVQ